jgi:hypothetical protein
VTALTPEQVYNNLAENDSLDQINRRFEVREMRAAPPAPVTPWTRAAGQT